MKSRRERQASGHSRPVRPDSERWIRDTTSIATPATAVRTGMPTQSMAESRGER